MNKMNTVEMIRKQDIIGILQNALNYGKPWDTLYRACIEEILDLRNQIVANGGSLTPVADIDAPSPSLAYPVLNLAQ